MRVQVENNTASYVTGIGITLFEYLQAAPGMGLSAASSAIGSANSSFAGGRERVGSVALRVTTGPRGLLSERVCGATLCAA